MSANPNLSRRHFLKLSLSAGAGLVLGFRLSDAEAAPADLTVIHMAQAGGVFEPNAYLQIAPDGTITLRVHRSEMGQGVNTAVPMILCEELEVDLSAIRYEQAPPDRVYGDQVTGGSVSISSSYRTLRTAGATARTMLIAAAAQTWGVDASECRAENGTVIHDATGRVLTYGELAETAATLPVPGSGDVFLKDPADFRLIGTSVPLIDSPDIVSGRATYASDLQLPGMLVAVVARCPVLGGDVASFDPTAALAVPGVRHVVEISSGVAVAADHTWAAIKGREALQVTWDEGGNASYTTAEVRQSTLDAARSRADA
ncbi:MAG: xanthine dehydrogenase family protein molybdopterin-binding subunit, partial [Anaerolineae bacterium]|nr:xanthine dehydrogenase family protein molybdopterin-binding subunit [Anaerolineae bacterium]